MAEHKLYQKHPKEHETAEERFERELEMFDNSERICVEMENGDLAWLQGEAIQKYKEGKLGSEPMTPERQRCLDEMDRDIMRIVTELYAQG